MPIRYSPRTGEMQTRMVVPDCNDSTLELTPEGENRWKAERSGIGCTGRKFFTTRGTAKLRTGEPPA